MRGTLCSIMSAGEKAKGGGGGGMKAASFLFVQAKAAAHGITKINF